MMRCCSLGSGSEGNALVVEASNGLFATRLLVDNGFAPRPLEQRLARAGLSLDDLDAVFVTHEHSDHVGGVAALLERRRIPVICSVGTLRAAGLDAQDVDFRAAKDGKAIDLGEMQLLPFTVPHDAAEPLQLVFTDGRRKLGLLTDAGNPAPAVQRALDGVHALLLECNYDPQMLASGPYPDFLKARIAGDQGHLSNTQAARLLSGLDRDRLSTVIGMHLSQRNNRHDLVERMLSAWAAGEDRRWHVADQREGFAWCEV
jgi:phosphoribosyl 1,2-cyclic phosphodiesterase